MLIISVCNIVVLMFHLLFPLSSQDSSYILSKKYSMKPLLNKEIGVFEGFSRLDEKNC